MKIPAFLLRFVKERPLPKYCEYHSCPLELKTYSWGTRFDTQTREGYKWEEDLLVCPKRQKSYYPSDREYDTCTSAKVSVSKRQVSVEPSCEPEIRAEVTLE